MTVRNYAILYVGGKRTSGGSVVGGGNSVIAAEPHDLDGPEHTNLGAYETTIDGGGSVIHAHGNTGTTETIDPALGNVHTLTLDNNCTFTLTAPVSGVACMIEIRALQDGTGGRTITWPGSIGWAGGTTPAPTTTAATTSVYLLETLDGGTTWLGAMLGGGGSALTISDDGTPLATAATSLDFVGAGVVASGAGAAKTITFALDSASLQAAGHYEVLMDGAGAPLDNGSGTDWLWVWVS